MKKLLLAAATLIIYQKVLGQCSMPANLMSGLVAYYPFCGNANDLSGNNNHGVAYNALLTTDRFGTPGSAYEFNGTNSYIDCGNASSFHITGNITMGGWLYMNGGSLNPRMISIESPEGNYRIATDGAGSPSRTIRAAYGNVGAEYILTTHQWHHIIYTYNAPTVKLFVNGVKVVEQTVVRTDSLTYTSSFVIGRKASAAHDPWGGKIDDIVIYNRSLSDAEIIQLYNIGITLPVRIISFTGEANERSAILRWKSEMERDLAYFAVEHSNDGRNFQTVARLSPLSSNNSQTNYSFVHTGVRPGHNYYRLRIVNADSTNEYTRVVKLTFNNDMITVLSCPVTNILQLKIFSSNPSKGKIILIETTGRIVGEKEFSFQQGDIVSWDISDCKAGIYFLKLEGPRSASVRIVKL